MVVGARLDARARARAFDVLERDHFDVLVIGGGVTGAGIARDAAMRGLHVALVEQEDFASGTSSRSSRLVHGGLRYLEHGQLHLVFESSRERRILMRIAPHLVRPLPFLWPVYEGARVPMWKIRSGMLLYDALSLFRNVAAHRRLGADRVIAMEPALRQTGLLGGARYYDAGTSDTRLTMETIRSAAAAGALIVNHAEVRSLLIRTGIVQGAVVADRLDGRQVTTEARVVVNAAGPWTDAVRKLALPNARQTVRTTKGSHVLLPRSRVTNEGALTLLSPIDGRVLFVLPSGQHTIIGTTDTDYRGDPANVRADDADLTYLLRSANAFFPDARLAHGDVISAWAGIRPLVADGSGPPATVSREHSIRWTVQGLLTITGGKLTTYRSMAAEVVDAVVRSRSLRRRKAATHRQALPGGDLASLAAELEQAEEETGAPRLAVHLVHAHGAEWRDVWDYARRDPGMREPIADGLPYVRAEVAYAIEHEMAATLDDILIRRIPVAFELRDHGCTAARAICPLVAELLDWDTARVAVELARYERAVLRMFGVEHPVARPAEA